MNLILVFLILVSCSPKISLKKTQRDNLAQVERKIFALVPEKEYPKDHLPSERLKLEAGDRTLFANWVSAGEKAPAFFILHGNGETLSDWRPLQAYFLDKGYSSFVFDYTGFGSSTGIPSVAKLNQDAVEAYKTFSTLTKGAKERIAFAHSLGCSMLLEEANKFSPLPDKIVTHAGFSTFREIGVEKKILNDSSKVYYPDVWNGYKNVRKLKMPLYIIHSAADKTIPIWMGEALAKSDDDTVKFLKLENSGHNAVYEDPTDNTWSQIFAFIKEQ
jgi:hypothetical protein